MSKKTTPATSLFVHLLGPFHVAVDGVTVERGRWSRRKPKLLVMLLALQPHHQLHREQLMEMLWPDLEPESAVNNLNKTIHMARHALEPELTSAAESHFILTQSQQVKLHGPAELWIDVNAFEQRAAEAIKEANPAAYEEALALYKGELLVEEPYEDWATIRREQLRMARYELLARLGQLYEARGLYALATKRLNELLALDSSDEEIHRRLMRVYALTGSKRQALRQFQICREELLKELNVGPDDTTRKLHELIISDQIQPISASLPQTDGTAGKAYDSIAVLPFANSSDTPDAEYLSDGITESIINSLSQLTQLRVMARSTVFSFKDQGLDPREIGHNLRVSTVLVGRMLQLGDELIIRTELIEVADGAQLWGEQYNRKLSDILTVQEEISREISGKLRLKLSKNEVARLTRRYTENTEAYKLYLKGRYFWNKRTESAIKKSINYFQQAIECDSRFALAYAGLADSYIVLASGGVSALAPREAVPRAKEAAVKALELDDTLAEAHAVLGHCLAIYDWNWRDAENEFQRAIKLNPNYATAHHWYAFVCLTASGRLEEAIAEERLAQELEPLSLIINTNLGTMLYLARRYDQAIEQYHSALEIDSDFLIAHWMLGLSYEQKKMYPDAIGQFQTALSLSPDSALSRALLGHVYAISGERKLALEMLDDLARLSRQRYVSCYRVASIHLGLGDQDRAFEWMERAIEERDGWLIWLKVDPVLDTLRTDPRFMDLVRRVGLTP